MADKTLAQMSTSDLCQGNRFRTANVDKDFFAPAG
jgi:hypothetical protein